MPKYGEFRKLQNLFESVYLIKDPYILKLCMASLVSQDQPCDPIWIIIVGASSSGKSEIINAFSSCKGVIQISTLSTNTFASGMKIAGVETSLLNRIGADTEKIGNGVITFKDLTSLLSERPDDKAIIMGQLREIYDGHYVKQFGNGKEVNWNGKITVLAGATHVIYDIKQQYAAMGERFLMYNLIQPDGVEAADIGMTNQESGKMKDNRLMLAEAVARYKDEIFETPEETPYISPEFKKELILLSEMATRARSSVNRNWRSPQQEIKSVHPPEMPIRFASTLQNLNRTLAVINWNETGKLVNYPEDKKMSYKIALDSINLERRVAMQELSKYDIIHTSGLAVKLNLPTSSVKNTLEDLTALKIADRVKGSGPRGDKWTIKTKYKEIMQKFENIKELGGELTEESLGEDNTHSIISAEDIKKSMEK